MNNKSKMYGKILAITKNVFVQKPDEFDIEIQFIARLSDRSYDFGGFGVTLWYSSSAINAINDLSKMIAQNNCNFSHLKHKSISNYINKALERSILNSQLYFSESILIKKDVKTLFEARKDSSEIEYAEKTLEYFLAYLSNQLTEWLILYPLYRIKADTLNVNLLGLMIISPDDKTTWEALQLKYPNLKIWNPKTGFQNYEKGTIFKYKGAISWLACVTTGDQDVAKEFASENMRLFISVIFSNLFLINNSILMKSAADAHSSCYQFPKIGSTLGMGQITSQIGKILPPLIQEISISSQDLNNVGNWIKRYLTATKEIRDRALKGAYFINLAMLKSGIDEFIYYYIALDALFGERNKVEKSIVKGINKIFQNDVQWNDKAEKLFDLRSELVHGSSYKIDDWKYIEHYKRHFKSNPINDVTKASMEALRTFLN